MSEQSLPPVPASDSPAREDATTLQRLIGAAERMFGVRRVFGEPIETPAGQIVPVATVFGGQGVGFGDGEISRIGGLDLDEDGEVDLGPSHGSGGGGGVGVAGWPAGAYVTENGHTRWQGAVDPNVVVLAGAALAGCAITAVAGVAVLRAFSRAAASIAASGAESFTAVSATAAETAVTLGGMARDSVASAAEAASSTTLGLAGMGSKLVTDSTTVLAQAAAAGLGSLADAVRKSR